MRVTTWVAAVGPVILLGSHYLGKLRKVNEHYDDSYDDFFKFKIYIITQLSVLNLVCTGVVNPTTPNAIYIRGIAPIISITLERIPLINLLILIPILGLCTRRILSPP